MTERMSSPCSLAGMSPGQSAAEFAIGFIVLIIILFGGAYFGMGMYFGQMASDQIREINLHKFEMADNPAAYSPGQVEGIINGSNLKGNISNTTLDAGSVKFVMDGQPDAVITGTKTYQTWLAPLKFTVSQAIQKSLLTANTAGATSFTSPPTDGPPPWQNKGACTDGGSQPLPTLFQCGSSSGSTLGEPHVKTLASEFGDPGTYLDVTDFSVSSPATVASTYLLARQEMPGCAGAPNNCQAQYDALLPVQTNPLYTPVAGPPPETLDTRVFYNPPGAPGTMQTIYVLMKNGPPPTEVTNSPQATPLKTSDKLAANQGFYIDPTNLYIKPPANFVQSCQLQQQAKCALKKAAARAVDCVSTYGWECGL